MRECGNDAAANGRTSSGKPQPSDALASGDRNAIRPEGRQREADRRTNTSDDRNRSGTPSRRREQQQSIDLRRNADATSESGPVSTADEIDGEVLVALRGNEIAENTKRSYRSQWRLFERWAALKGISALPASPTHVALYLAERLFTLNHKPSTLRAAAAAIAHVHKTAGRGDPCADPEVRNALRSASRIMGTIQKQADALTSQVFLLIIENANRPRLGRGGRLENRQSAGRRARSDIAMISLMRDAMLRVSEAAALKWEDLEAWGDGSGRLLLTRSKTDKQGRGAVLYVSAPTMVRLDSIRGKVTDKDSIFGLSAHQIAMRIKQAAESAGLGSGFSGHSPRVGMTIDLARTGIELPRLMTAGRWSSPTMPALYTRNEAAAKGAVAEYYGAASNKGAIESTSEDEISEIGGETDRALLQQIESSANMTTRVDEQNGSDAAKKGGKSPVTAIIGDRSSSSITATESRTGLEKRSGQSARSRRLEGFQKRNRIVSKSYAYSLARRVLTSQMGESAARNWFSRAGTPLLRSFNGLMTVIKTRPAVSFLFFRCLPLALFIVVAGYALSSFNWEGTWVPALYVVGVAGVVMTNGLLFPDPEDGLREFFWASVFFVLSMPILQFVPIGMDAYGFYRVGDFASTHLPYMLALLVNLALASSAGLMFHVLRDKFRSKADGGNITLKQACITTLLPLGAVYAVVSVISNASAWIQLGLLIPSLAVAFAVLLALFDRTVDSHDKDRQFLLYATFTFILTSVIVGIVIIFAFYMLPGVSQVLPDHNLLRSWQIDFAEADLTSEEAARLLRLGFLWHATITFVYMHIVVGGNVLVAVFHMGKGNSGQPNRGTAAAAVAAAIAKPVPDEQSPSRDQSENRRGMPFNFAGLGAFNR